MTAAALTPTLEKNLRALATRDRELVDRLLQPAAVDHVILSPDAPPLYRHHGGLLPMDVGPGELEGRLAAWPEEAPEALLFGVGLGELLAHLLRRRPKGRVVAWDRDPWLVRETLSRWDYSQSIASGRLELRLGVDLALQLDRLRGLPRIDHPTLVRVYRGERKLLESPESRGPWAAVGLGGLFVHDVAQALRAEGHRVMPMEVARWSREEVEDALARLDPALVLTVNTRPGVSELCEAQGRSLLVWEIDPTTERTTVRRGTTERTYVFTYREARVPALREAGYVHVEHLPLAADPEARRPVELEGDEQERYRAPVCFVGASMADRAAEYRRKFHHLYATWRCGDEAGLAEADARVEEVLSAQREEPSRYLIPGLAEEAFGEFLEAARLCGTRQDPVGWLAEVAASEKRRGHVGALGKYGVRVWGDDGWSDIDERGGVYMGRADHGEELTRIYSGSAIQIDVNRLYQPDIVPLRVFEVLACGGFLLAEHSEDLEELFAVGEELETYRTREELVEKVSYYLEHPDEARAIAARGRTAIVERHTVRQRVRRMLDVLSGSG